MKDMNSHPIWGVSGSTKDNNIGKDHIGNVTLIFCNYCIILVLQMCQHSLLVSVVDEISLNIYFVFQDIKNPISQPPYFQGLECTLASGAILTVTATPIPLGSTLARRCCSSLLKTSKKV
jgi:hypothetical protein